MENFDHPQNRNNRVHILILTTALYDLEVGGELIKLNNTFMSKHTTV